MYAVEGVKPVATNEMRDAFVKEIRRPDDLTVLVVLGDLAVDNVTR